MTAVVGPVVDADKRRVYDMQKAGDEEAAKRKQDQRNAANTASMSRSSEKTRQSNGYSFSFKQTAPPKFSAKDGNFSFSGSNGTHFTFRTGDFDSSKGPRFTFHTADFDDTDDAPKRTSSKPRETKVPKVSTKVSYTRMKPQWKNRFNDEDEDDNDFFPYMHRDTLFRNPFQDFHSVFSNIADQLLLDTPFGNRHNLGLEFRGQPRPKPKPKKPDMEDDMYDWSKPMFQHRKKKQEFIYDDEDDGISK